MTTIPGNDNGSPEHETDACRHKWAFIQCPIFDDMFDTEFRIQCMDCGEIKETVKHSTMVKLYGKGCPPTLTIILSRLFNPF